MAFSFDALIFLAFIIIVGLLVFYDRKNVKPAGLVLMRRTQNGKEWLERVSARWPRFWSVLTLIGVIVSIPAMAYVCYFLISNAINLVTGQVVGAVKLVLPWSGFEERPGLFLVPWYFWVIGIAFVVIPHELCHGIACRISRIRVKALGWMILIFIPGAFVDPDERQLKKAPRLAKLRVFAAGSFANIVLGLICCLVTFAILAAFFTPHGLIPTAVAQDSPAAIVNLSGALLSIDSMTINSQEDLANTMQAIPIGSRVLVETTAGNYTVTTVKHPELNQSYLGVLGPYSQNHKLLAGLQPFEALFNFTLTLFSWLFTISIGIGLFNLLPIKPLDGGLIFEEIAGKFLRRNATRVVTIIVSLALAVIVIFNIVGPAVMA